MKLTLVSILSVLLLLLATGCSNEPPEARVQNNNAEDVNVSIKPDAGNTLNVNGVKPGARSGYVVVSEGSGTISASRSGTSPEDIRYTFEKGETYLITISSGDKPTLSTAVE
ncbi:MAG: hypothetical protein JNL74_18670 [Fibrobacteres bacterium]|nr:hypothetical protein [Fibrobacterota bacterium]